MTRLEAFIIGQLRRGPRSVLLLAMELEERTDDVKRACERLAANGLVEHGVDGWKLVKEAA